MRHWLMAKAEEDKRKQEEEKTRQESFRLEQRRIEQSMLRESLQAGVPPTMVPMIYAGMGGGNLANVSMEWLQQYAGQLQVAQQQQLQQIASPELRRETRMIGQTHPPAYPQPIHQQVLPPQQPVEQAPPIQPLQTTFSAYQPVQQRGPSSSAPRSAAHASLPRLTTSDMYIQQPPQSQPQPNPGSAHPLQQNQTWQQDPPASSPSIYFHHWVPPNESKTQQQPQTPASKGDPHSAHPGGSHLSESDHKESPRKRKAQGAHPPVPPPASGPHYTSPSFSTTSSSSRKAGHARTRSNASTRDSDSRPHSRRDPEHPRPARAQAADHAEDNRRARELSAGLPRPLPLGSAARPMDERLEASRREEREVR